MYLQRERNGYSHPKGSLLLHITSWYGMLSIVEAILKKSADVDPRDSEGSTPMSLAARRGHEVVVKLLLQRTVDADSKDLARRTPLS